MAERGPEQAPLVRSAETFRKDDEELRRMSAWFRDFARGTALPPSKALDFELCLNELMANSIEHGDVPEAAGDHPIRVELEYDGHWLRATVEDEGAPFDPRSAAPRPAKEDLGSMHVGGWGVAIVRSFADEIHYERVGGEGAGGRNRTRIGMRTERERTT